MFKINDYVMYGITGVCKILDIKEEKDRNSVIKKYYVNALIVDMKKK